MDETLLHSMEVDDLKSTILTMNPVAIVPSPILLWRFKVWLPLNLYWCIKPFILFLLIRVSLFEENLVLDPIINTYIHHVLNMILDAVRNNKLDLSNVAKFYVTIFRKWLKFSWVLRSQFYASLKIGKGEIVPTSKFLIGFCTIFRKWLKFS